MVIYGEKLPLPSGGWVRLRDPEEVTTGDLEDIMRNWERIDAERPFGLVIDMTTGIKLLCIADWYIPYLPVPDALPRNEPAVLRAVRIPDNRALERFLAPAQAVLFPSAASPDDDQLADPASPTMPANGSKHASRDGTSNQPALASLNGSTGQPATSGG